MNSIFELSRPFEQFRKQEKFSEALLYFKENKIHFTNEEISQNIYLVSDMLTCLRKLNHFEAGFKFLAIYNIQINENTNDRVLNSYGWFLHSNYKFENSDLQDSDTEHTFLDDEDESKDTINYNLDKNELVDKISEVITLLSRNINNYSKSVISNLFTIVLKSEKKKPAPNWRLVNEFCNKIDRENLSKDCSTIKVERKGQLKDMELASDFENWYAYKTKALTKLGEWQECFDLSKEALDKIENFHYSNDVWFSRRVALSKRNIGCNIDETIEELQMILKKKREWFIQKELAELYFEKGNIEFAFKQAMDSMNNFGKLESKVNLLQLIGKILRQQNKLELSFKHFSLSKLIKQQEETKLPQKLFDEIRTFSFPEIQQTDFKNLKNELQKYWDSFKTQQTKTFDKPKDNLRGEIAEIRNDNERGKDGFIKSTDKRYYFSVNPNYHSISKIVVGAKVLFEVLPQNENNKKEKARIKNITE